MQELVIDFLNNYGYLGVALLMALENLFPPIPSEVILTFSGFMTTYSEMQPGLVILFATIGSVIGALILYFIGYLIPVQALRNLLDGKWGMALHLGSDDLSKAGIWFVHKGALAVFLCRFVPIVRSLISIPAGTARMHLLPFLLLTTLGTAIWNTVLVTFGAIAGESWGSIVGYMDVYTILAVVLFGILLLAVAYRLYTHRFKKN